MKLRVLTSKNSLKGKRVLLRVDWNVPLTETFAPEESLKLERSFNTINDLVSRGAVVVILTHLGRPNGRDEKFSTKRLAVLAHRMSQIPIHFLGESLDDQKDLSVVRETIRAAKPGTVFLLENVRFFKGEEQNSPAFSKALASLWDLFINDAFASCHRAHSSVVGIAKYIPSYAGPSLIQEVQALEKIISKPKRPFIAVIGGAKLSSKIEVLSSLLVLADKVLIGGAMAHVFFYAKKLSIGKSFIEKESVAFAKKILKNPKIVLPTDFLVASKIKDKVPARVVSVGKIRPSDVIGDIGTETMMAWAKEIKKAKTIVWNGPVGVAEYSTFSHGSMLLARAIASQSKGSTYGVVGGGDTLPTVLKSGMSEWIDHLSTGGGAMLEFIANKGNLPGLRALRIKH
jgi:phosphoglycerate kinase